jgi:hypothetical protein
MTGREHSKLLAIFLFVQAGLQAFGGIITALIYGGMGAFFATSGDVPDAEVFGGVIVVIAIVVGIVALLFAAFFALAGWRLHKNLPGARGLGIAACCLALLGIPLGTALGVYGLWFLLGDAGKAYFSGSTAGYGSPVPPPAPNSWQ